MLSFSVPIKSLNQKQSKSFYSFSLTHKAVLFAGSRNNTLPKQTCSNLIEAFARLGFGFFVGCANGVDRSFRRALANSNYQDRCFIACAFKKRTKPAYSYGLYASLVVPASLHPKAALFRRTLWLVRRCAMIVLFPEDPHNNNQWGKGSSLAFKAAMFHLKPVFVVTTSPPKESTLYKVLPSDLFGVIQGYWVVPHTIKKGGTCYEQY
jgi:hypothetical protein